MSALARGTAVLLPGDCSPWQQPITLLEPMDVFASLMGHNAIRC